MYNLFNEIWMDIISKLDIHNMLNINIINIKIIEYIEYY